MQWKQIATVCARHAAVAIGYALGYALFRTVTLSQWTVISGFRLLVLLLVPSRYWLALAIGEVGPLAYTGATCADQLGVLWAWLESFPPIVFGMPAVGMFRDRLGLTGRRNSLHVGPLLWIAFLVSILWTGSNAYVLAAAHTPPGYILHWDVVIGRWFVGNFLGILTVVPLALCMREIWRQTPQGELRTRLSESRLLLEAVTLLLPCLALLAWVGHGGIGEGARQAARIAMFVPVVMLALRYGWHGAAIGGSAASVAAVLTISAIRDAETLQAHIFICFAITAMMLLGGRIAQLNAREARERAESRMALALAQRNVYLGEVQLRQTSFAIAQVQETVTSSFALLLGRVRQLVPPVDDRPIRRQAEIAKQQLYRLSDTLFPVVWKNHGLPTALREGSLARAMSESGVVYWCEFRNKAALSKLSQPLNLTLYRLACEAVGFACSDARTTHIHLTMRSGALRSRGWAALIVDYWSDESRLGDVRRDELLSRLPFNGFGVNAMRDRAAAFQGAVRSRSKLKGRRRVSMILHDPDDASWHADEM